MGLLEGVHAADSRAIGMGVLVPAAHAVDDGHPLRLLPLGGEDLAAGGAAGAGEPLELQAGDDVRRETI